jgi:hypothetical protein
MWPLTLLEACGTLKSSVEKKHVLLISVFLFGFDHYITIPNHAPPPSPSLLVLGKALPRINVVLQFLELQKTNCQNFQLITFHSHQSLHKYEAHSPMSCARDLHVLHPRLHNYEAAFITHQ